MGEDGYAIGLLFQINSSIILLKRSLLNVDALDGGIIKTVPYHSGCNNFILRNTWCVKFQLIETNAEE